MAGLDKVISGKLVVFGKMEVVDWEVEEQKPGVFCSQISLDVMNNMIKKAMIKAEEVVREQNNVINFIVWAFVPT